MYAVIKTGGKQYRVEEGETLEIEHVAVKGNKVTFTPVLVVTDDGKTIYGRKDLKPYTVTAKLLGDAKGDKVEVFKYRPKSGYSVRQGHRQLKSLVEITSIGEKQSARRGAPKEAADKQEPPPDEEKEAEGS